MVIPSPWHLWSEGGDTAQGLQPGENISGMKNWLAFSSAKPSVQRGKCHKEFSLQGNEWAALCKQILQNRKGHQGRDLGFFCSKQKQNSTFWGAGK